MKVRTVLARRRGFQLLHKYVVPEWTESANTATFGTCFTPHGHGHNYELEVYVEGPIDNTTGMIANLADVDRWIGELVEPIDGKHVNLELPEFDGRKGAVPTTERLAVFLAQRTPQVIPRGEMRVVKLRLYEYDDLWVDVWLS